MKSFFNTSFFNRTFFLVAAALAGLFFSGYLFVTHYLAPASDSLLFKVCAVSEYVNCHRVNASGYSTILHFPVAGLGMFFYCFILVTIAFKGKGTGRIFRTGLMAAALMASSAAVLAIIPLAYLSFAKIGALCPFCVVTWVCSITVLALVVAVMRGEGTIGSYFREVPAFLRESYRMPRFFGYLGCCLLIFILLVLSSFVLGTLGRARTEAQVRAVQEQVFGEYLNAPRKQVNLTGIPAYLGNPLAKVRIVEFMNFNCPACRRASAVNQELVAKYGDRVGFFLKNFPLDGKCNPQVEHKGDGLTCMASLISIGLRGRPGFQGHFKSIMESGEKLNPKLIYNSVRAAAISDAEADGMMASQKVRGELLKELEEAKALGISSTPTYVVNGKVLRPGLFPRPLLERIIEAELLENR